MTKRPDAVFTDMDGSLLGPTPECRIGEQDLATIHKLKSLGIPVFVATGRHHGICRWYFDEIGTEYPAITCNGAMLYDFANDTIVQKALLPQDVLHELVQFAQEHGLYYYVHTAERCLLDPSKATTPNYEMDLRLFDRARDNERGFIDDSFDIFAHEVIKFMIPDCSDEQCRIFAATDLNSRVDAACSWHNFLDINPGGTNKGVAVTQLAKQYGFDLANTVALGDNFNDEPMLRAVGYPVVPCSGEPAIQAIAKLVTSASGDNPLTHAINTLFPDLLAD